MLYGTSPACDFDGGDEGSVGFAAVKPFRAAGRHVVGKNEAVFDLAGLQGMHQRTGVQERDHGEAGCHSHGFQFTISYRVFRLAGR